VGGLYSYVSHGLGRELGMATGFSIVFAYSIFEASLAGAFAYFANQGFQALTGINVPWPVFALACVIGVGVLQYFDVRLSAFVLGIGLVTEVIVMLVFDLFVFLHAGSSSVNIQVSAFNPALAFQGFPAQGKLAAGAAGIGLFFAFWSWVGFEMAPNYGEESKDPKRTVPLALYISVIGVGIFYMLTSWSGMSAYSHLTDAIAQAQTNTAQFYLAPATKLAGLWLSQAMSVLILTGSFACALSLGNTAVRYFYSLGRERLLPNALGKTHARHKSPYIAAGLQLVISVVIVAIFAIFTKDTGAANNPNTQAFLQLYGLVAVLGVIVIMAVEALVSVAIVVYFLRHHRGDTNWFTTLIAPLVSAFVLLYVTKLLFDNIQFLGSGYSYANWFGWLDLAIFLVGLAVAFYLKYRDPSRYEQIGRLIYEGL
jgi:amino acid transporter